MRDFAGPGGEYETRFAEIQRKYEQESASGTSKDRAKAEENRTKALTQLESQLKTYQDAAAEAKANNQKFQQELAVRDKRKDQFNEVASDIGFERLQEQVKGFT